MAFLEQPEIPNQFIKRSKKGTSLFLKREDMLHPEVSGNKFRKLKYNLLEARSRGFRQILTFGGAFSNHIAATAAAGKIFGFDTIGIIRGEELGDNLEKTLRENETLSFAVSCGMQLDFMSRNDYRKKTSEEILEKLQETFGRFYPVPEGGTNELAVKGCEEILTKEDAEFDVICCAVGTGGTISGLINAASPQQKILGFPALKGDFLSSEIQKHTVQKNWELILNYHFGGYAKVDAELIGFINGFHREHRIPLDPVYTGKMMYGIMDLMEKEYFSENTRILAIHTGGLQGIPGMNRILKKKDLPQIDMHL